MIASALAVLGLGLGSESTQAQATTDFLTVSGVEVDVTAGDAVTARDAAFVEAQRKAYEMLLAQLADGASAQALPPLSDAEISDLVEDFEIESERSSTVRYIGRFTFRFKGAEVRNLLESHGVRYAVLQSPPLLVLPVFSAGEQSLLWGDNNPWFAAWLARPTAGQLVPLKLPLGDLQDMTALEASQALAGDAQRLQSLAQRYDAAAALVVEAQPSADGRSVAATAKRYGALGLEETIAATGNGSDLNAALADAVRQLDQQIQTAWKDNNLLDSSAERVVTVTVPIETYRGWLDLKKKLASVTMVREARLLALSSRSAELDLTFLGDITQLQTALAQRGLTLLQEGADYALMAGAPALP